MWSTTVALMLRFLATTVILPATSLTPVAARDEPAAAILPTRPLMSDFQGSGVLPWIEPRAWTTPDPSDLDTE